MSSTNVNLQELRKQHADVALMHPHDLARKLIDLAHSYDPKRDIEGRPAELVYADRIENWVVKLAPKAPAILRLAARCQHLERWETPRDSFPAGKVGYLTWRRFLYVKQAERAAELLREAGVSQAEIDDASLWISKTDLKSNAGTQALEDAAILVFLENEIGTFVAQHDYPREKFIDILRKSWRKLSAEGQAAAGTLDLPESIASLVGEALG